MARVGLLFPGQGAQTPGMCKSVIEEFPAAREVLQRADEALDIPLETICMEGPEERLKRTDVSQPAILAISMAVLEAVRAEGADLSDATVVGAAGLSLGEYTALTAAGSMELEEAVRLVSRRGSYMQEACDQNPGTMYSIIGLDAEDVEKACEQARETTEKGVWPANYNCPGQIVISGDVDAAAEAAELCQERGARRAIQLKVAGAFHSEFMEPAAEKLYAELKRTDFTAPTYPVVSNVTAQPGEGPEEIRELLRRQLTSPVRWQEGMEWFLEHDVNQFYEIGPGRVLRGLLRRIDRDADCTSVRDADGVRQMAEDVG